MSSADRRKREKVSQNYLVYLKPDPYAGQAYRRQIPYGISTSSPSDVNGKDIHPELMDNDANGDGRISRREVSGKLNMKFWDIDTNGDGYLSEEEYEAYLRNR